ncbi:DNA-binding SATB1 [Paramuricea clavata]|uniref:DNA-binding SATB1 n=1 Tax=Paramuricea clavata TaxID=317549 RepID=A0A6S7G517_PARCT|nr:DNA-binding SATB1 [Paramuricea clavata]
MDEQNSGFILCDISFNGQLVADVKLPRACSMGNIVQGLWLDDNFRKTGLQYLKAKDEKAAQKTGGEKSTPLKSFGGIDRSILRAYVAIRIMPAWKWLEFKDFIVDFENKKDCYTVGDVLGTLCTGLHKPVLRIVPKSENEADDQEVKNIVNELLKTRSLATLAAAECPLSNGMLSLIAQGKYTSTISHDRCQAFVHWLRRQDLTNNGLRNSEQRVETPKPDVPVVSTPQPSKNFKPRITFSQNETDNLTEWFNEDERPSREVMQQYTEILNIPRQMASIRLLTQESIYFWFKNKRSKKRKEDSSLLEPWEMSESGGTPQVTMAIGDTPQATGDTPTSATTSQLAKSSTPQVAMATRENGGASIAMAITEESSDEVRMPINGLATMLARYTPQDRQPRKIPKSRITFDPQTELSSLNKWFNDNERPDKEIIEEYTNILNEARSQKSKRMLTSDSIAMWFKNKRAKRRRSEESFVGENSGQQQVVEANEGNKNEAGATAGMDTTTVTDGTTSITPATIEVTVSSVTASGAASDQMETDGEDHERNIFSAGLVAVKTATI